MQSLENLLLQQSNMMDQLKRELIQNQKNGKSLQHKLQRKKHVLQQHKQEIRKYKREVIILEETLEDLEQSRHKQPGQPYSSPQQESSSAFTSHHAELNYRDKQAVQPILEFQGRLVVVTRVSHRY